MNTVDYNHADPEKYCYPKQHHLSLEDRTTLDKSIILFTTTPYIATTRLVVASPTVAAVFVPIFDTKVVVT